MRKIMMMMAVMLVLMAGTTASQDSPTPQVETTVNVTSGVQFFSHTGNFNINRETLSENGCGLSRLHTVEGNPYMVSYSGEWELGDFNMHGSRAYLINSTVPEGEHCTFDLLIEERQEPERLSKNSWNLVSPMQERSANQIWKSGEECVLNVEGLLGTDIDEDANLDPETPYWLWLDDSCGSSNEGDDGSDDGGNNGGNQASFDDLSIELEKPEGSVQASQDVIFNTNIENSGDEEVNVENITYSISTADTGFEAMIAHNESVDVAETGFSDEWRLRIAERSTGTFHYGDFLETALVDQEDEDRPNAVDEIDEFKLSVTAWESYPNGNHKKNEKTVPYGEGESNAEDNYCQENLPSDEGICKDEPYTTGDWEIKIEGYNDCEEYKNLVCIIDKPGGE